MKEKCTLANTISISYDSDREDGFSISNGATSVLISVIGLSGSKIAKSDEEKKFIIWILEKDQSCCGIGTVGFELSELPWSKKNFENERKFMLEVLEGVRNKVGWETLDYHPNEEIINYCIDKLENMFNKMTSCDIDEQAINEWRSETEKEEPMNNGFPKCKKHGVLLTLFGCHVCND